MEERDNITISNNKNKKQKVHKDRLKVQPRPEAFL